MLLTGATGFIGSHLYPALVAAGHEVICGTRNPLRARHQYPKRSWVKLDINQENTLANALQECEAAFYLVHSMSDGGDYAKQEAEGAKNFLLAAENAGVKRIVYLGGVTPAQGKISDHLKSRMKTGEILRGGSVSTIELRAAMIIGAGSASFTMVKDLAQRLPAMLLPRWLRNSSHPVGVDDVLRSLLFSLTFKHQGSKILEVPGPERISHKDLLNRTASVLGHKRMMINVPVLTPRLSSYWIAAVTRVDLKLAQELVEGVRYDLDPTGQIIWQLSGETPVSIVDATELALADEAAPGNLLAPSAETRAKVIGLDHKGRG